MPFPPAFLDELRARTPLAALVGRWVKLARSGRNWKGCCPFHNEKTPSFTVYEDGYHCFGCGAHGDAVSFAMQMQGLTFPDAVAQLAAEAGLEVPKSSPRAAEAERQRLDLGAVLEAAQASFVRRLREKEGAAGLAYLRGRGLSDETITRFGLGWSGDGRGSLTRELGAKGVEPARLLEAGLLRDREGGERRELFFSRVIFPIRGRRGRVISFGGRTLGDGKPKYLNGPETSLFQKRRTLFALDVAREGVRAGADLVVVEGYMDAIALHQAGFPGAVAPLGTALTAEQLEELWRVAPEPILCFDGDTAGARATRRAIEVALPLLTPEQGFRIASLPPGEDPDSLIRRGGVAAVQDVLAAARPLAEALYTVLCERAAATPEGRARLRRQLEASVARIGDRVLADEYRRVLLHRFFADGGVHAPRTRPARAAPPSQPRRDTLAEQNEIARELVAVVRRHPDILPDVDEALGALDLPPALAALRQSLRAWACVGPVLERGHLAAQLDATEPAAAARSAIDTGLAPRPGPSGVEAADTWWRLFERYVRGGRSRELEPSEVAAAAGTGDLMRDRAALLRTARRQLQAAVGEAACIDPF